LNRQAIENRERLGQGRQGSRQKGQRDAECD